MNNRITNKINNDKLNSKIQKEETKNSIYNSKNNEQEIYSSKTILNKMKKLIFPKKLKHVNVGINFEKLIINTKRNNNQNNSPPSDPINRNFSYNNVILLKKNNNLNNNHSQSILSKPNKKKDIVIPKNYKNSSKNVQNNHNINKGKTYFVKNVEIPQETLEKSVNHINKLNNNSIYNNDILQSYERQKISTNSNSNKLIFKNNSFTSQNKNMILMQSNRIKNCYMKLIINKTHSNKGNNKIKSIPFSLKKNKQKINTNTENNNNNNNNIKDYYTNNDEMIHRIYKNEKMLQKKKMNKVISVKTKCNNEIILTDKNNDNIKKSVCNSIFTKRINTSRKNGLCISPSKQSIELADNKSLKIIRKLDLNDESKKEGNDKIIDYKKKTNNKRKISKIKILHKNEKTRFIIKNNKSNNHFINNNRKNKEKNENNISKTEKISKTVNMSKNSSFTKNHYDILNKNENYVKKSISKNDINKKGKIYNYKLKKKTETIKDAEEEEDEIIENIENSLKNSNILKENNVFHISNINSCLKIISNLLDKDSIIETFISFCDLETLNKSCLISKNYYNHIKPIIYKIIMQKVFNYNNNIGINHKNKIKNSLFKYSSLSQMSSILLEKKYKDLLFENKSIYDEAIKKDLTRTIIGDLSFQYGNENYNKLYHLLTAYSNYNKNIGYAQGLNLLAANCIFLFEKEIDEFLFLDALIQKFNLEYIIGVSNNLIIKLEGISNCLNKYIPKIKNYLGNMNLNYEFFIAGWVLTLFSNSMNNHYLFYIWDYMIIFGWDYFNCFVIAVLKRYEDEILSVPQNQLTFYMKNILRNNAFQNDFEIIVKSSFNYLLKEKIFK